MTNDEITNDESQDRAATVSSIANGNPFSIVPHPVQTGELVAVCVSGVSGLPRPEVNDAALREGLGFIGNKHSVGGDREICLFDEETYDALRADDMKVVPGSFGENIVTRGIPFGELQPGDHMTLGDDAEIEITMVRKPCSNLTQIDARLPEAIVGRSGWMARVVRGGSVRPGDAIHWLRRE